ncbi:hydroxyphenylacetyl-CoA thioesterase PaaI [Spelaeicoccus albus]|uniref:Acyl-CoA thioesterase n=1 Tax=Spelaeicoccus albus TaxID=1280376 RepID=A0A7Z0D286_9MICO|nr:hydroxyphenylacetyl-CoA thioesterase PaaI [Spelaeicoccus albus]NYI67527.1 acyl-CoA thioesterase [Spelaeicoccus albus]
MDSRSPVGSAGTTGPEAMYAEDKASQAAGITLDDFGPGFARCSMTVREDMVNGHLITHGGYVFVLADTTFAMTCNEIGSVTVAAGADINFLKPTRLGDVLVAEGRCVTKNGRSGIYDVHVSRNGEPVAEFRGRSRTLPAPK